VCPRRIEPLATAGREREDEPYLAPPSFFLPLGVGLRGGEAFEVRGLRRPSHRGRGYRPRGTSSTRRKWISPPSDWSPIRPGRTVAAFASLTFFPFTWTMTDGPSTVIS